jgi:uncharacterized repeat protein (TIGR01451 family)
MGKKFRQYLPQGRGAFAALALTALAAAGAPETACASTTAGTTILNVVTVEYNDASNTNSFKAAFSTTVTVNLVKAGLSITTPPSDAAYAPAFSCANAGTYASGDTFSAVYALTATANGQDSYKLDIASSATNGSSSATYTFLKADGTPLGGALGASSEKVLNSAIAVGTLGKDTLLFPGGSLKDEANGGLKQGDVVVVDYGATKTAYLVKQVILGRAAGYDINGDTASTGTGNKTDEVRDQVQVEAWPNNTLGIGDANKAPDFEVLAPAAGTVVGQMALVQIEVRGISSVKGADATVEYKLSATDSAGNNIQYVGVGGSNTCPAGTFLATNLQILKQVRNLTKLGSWAATASSDPGEILEYLVTVTNNGGQANSATVMDTIPIYTKLVTYSDSYGTGSANETTGFFAQLSDGTNSVDLTMDANGEVARQPASPAPTVGYGKAAGVGAGQALNFYLGQGSDATKGGTVPSCSDSSKNTLALCVAPETWSRTYTIKYRVKVD